MSEQDESVIITLSGKCSAQIKDDALEKRVTALESKTSKPYFYRILYMLSESVIMALLFLLLVRFFN